MTYSADMRNFKPKLPYLTLPKSWGKSRCRQYEALVADYQQAGPHQVPHVVGAMLLLLDSAPRATRRAREQLCQTLRAWNRGFDGPKPVECPSCGEFRAGHIQGEAFALRHLTITGGSENAIRLKLDGCMHEDVALNCLVCDHTWAPSVAMFVEEPDYAEDELPLPPIRPDDHGVN